MNTAPSSTFNLHSPASGYTPRPLISPQVLQSAGDDGPGVLPSPPRISFYDFDFHASRIEDRLQIFLLATVDRFRVFLFCICGRSLHMLTLNRNRTSKRNIHVHSPYRGHASLSSPPCFPSSSKCLFIQCHHCPFHPQPTATILIQLTLWLEPFHANATFGYADR